MSSQGYLEVRLPDKEKLYLCSRFATDDLEREVLMDLAVSFSAKNKSLKEGNVGAWIPGYISRRDEPGYLAVYQEVNFKIYDANCAGAEWKGTIDVPKNTLILPAGYFIKTSGCPPEIRDSQNPNDWKDEYYDKSTLRTALIMLNQRTKMRFINPPDVDEDYKVKVKVEFKVQPKKDDLYFLKNRLFKFDGCDFQELQYNQR